MKQFSLFSAMLVITALLSACGGGGGSAAPAPASTKWTGTKQLGVTGANTVSEGIAIDTNGNVYVAGSTNGALDGNALAGTQDLFLSMYNSVGTKVRTKQLGVATKITAANSVAVDSNGNVYVAGATYGALDSQTLTGTQDYFLTMYDAAGNKVRTKQAGVASALTVATGVAVDLNGNVYVTGYTNGALTGTLTGTQDFFLAMYDKNGSLVRTKQLGVASAQTAATSVAVDANSNVYVVGYTYGDLAGTGLTGTRDYFLTMYDSAGNVVRTKQLGVAGKSTAATGVAVDASGNVYVAGFTYGGLSGNTLTGTQDMFVTTYDSAGNWVRTKQLGATNTITAANSVAVDSNGNILVAGSTYGNLAGLTGVQDFFVTTYDSTGTLLRTKQLGASGTYTEANGVAIDANRNVYVSGYTKGGLDGNTLKGIQDFFITKFDSLGVKQ